jgi:hypothetical protein
MGKPRFNRSLQVAKPAAAAAAQAAPAAADQGARFPLSVFVRFAPGVHAVRGAEVEIYDNGARIAGGYDVVQFNLWVEAWVEIRVLR